MTRPTIDEEVIEFINRRFPMDCNWTNGNCYYFAKILCTRFNYLKMYYMPITGHFVAGIDNQYYDYTGRIILNEPIYDFDALMCEDFSLYLRLLRDCVK